MGHTRPMRRRTTLSLALALLAAVAGSARAADRRPTVAVLYFDYAGKDEEMALLRKGLAQMLISDLSAIDSIRLVERDRLEEVLAELELGRSGKIDPATAARVGKLLGARYMVLGGYFELRGALRVDARVVEVETGRVLQSVGVTGKPDDFLAVEQALATDLTSILARQLKTAAPAAPRVKRPARLSTRVAVLYSQALAQADRGQKEQARETLRSVVKQQEDFMLATMDLDKLMQ
jgi:TolB-like protein